LVRIYKKPQLFPPFMMRKYSDTEWFYYGDPGDYTIEYLDQGPDGWVSEFIETKIVGDVPTKPVDPTDPPKPTDPTDPGSGYAQIRIETAKMVKAINDPSIANSLIKEYTAALSKLDGTISEMRLMIRNARRAAFQKVPVRNAQWNDLIIKIDQMIIEQNVDTPTEYKAAITAYINGISDGLK